jgi:hypothetical protein
MPIDCVVLTVIFNLFKCEPFYKFSKGQNLDQILHFEEQVSYKDTLWKAIQPFKSKDWVAQFHLRGLSFSNQSMRTTIRAYSNQPHQVVSEGLLSESNPFKLCGGPTKRPFYFT